jgi:hypothetical protein
MPNEKMVGEISYTASYGRIAGIRIGVIDDAGIRVMQYPITVSNENDQVLGLVENPNDLLQLWNSDPVNRNVGRLELEVESTMFWLIPYGKVKPRGFVRGNAYQVGEFSDDFSLDFNT